MSELTEILVRHNCTTRYDEFASQPCPACAQKALVEWLRSIGIGEGPVDSVPLWFKFPWAYWQALCQGVLGEEDGDAKTGC